MDSLGSERGHLAGRKSCCEVAAGAVAWVSVFLAAGYLFGTIPFIAQNREYPLIDIIVLSLAPAFWQLFRTRLPGHVA